VVKALQFVVLVFCGLAFSIFDDLLPCGSQRRIIETNRLLFILTRIITRTYALDLDLGCGWLLESANYVFLLEGKLAAGHIILSDHQASIRELRSCVLVSSRINEVVLQNFTDFTLLMLHS